VLENQALIALLGIFVLIVAQVIAGARTKSRMRNLQSRARELSSLMRLESAPVPVTAVRETLTVDASDIIDVLTSSWAGSQDDLDYSAAVHYMMRNWSSSHSSEVLAEGVRRHVATPGHVAHIESTHDESGLAWFEDDKGNRDYLTYKGSICSAYRQPSRAGKASAAQRS